MGFSPVDGPIIKFSDESSAFIEADQSIKYGIISPHLYGGRNNIQSRWNDNQRICGIKVAKIYKEFSL